MRHRHHSPTRDQLWASESAFIQAQWNWIMVTLLDSIVSALQKLDSDESPLGAEIAALQGQVSQFEADVQKQAEAAVAAALNTAGITPAQISALTDRVTALEAADSALNTALTPVPVTAPVEPVPVVDTAPPSPVVETPAPVEPAPVDNEPAPTA